MRPPGDRDLLWRKAAVIGSLWAASEIVLGSFLKNAHIPFAGLLLTGIGVAILVAGHRLWPERGLLWRAGLVCAALKSVSPSAVLLSPMAAIFAEGVCAELGVRLLGANAAGYLLAGGLAMSWGLVHKIGKLYLFYGPESLVAYARGLEKLRVWLGRPGGVWEPLALLFTAYFLAGAAAAVLGLRAASGGGTVEVKMSGADYFRPRSATAAGGSALLLPLHLGFIAFLMVWGRLPLWLAAGFAAAYGLLCAVFYRRAAALLARKGLWVGLLLASLLAGWLLGDWGAGLRMAARALALTLGFAAVAQELLNPAVRRWLERRIGRAFFDTLEYAFGGLPLVLEALPSGRDMLFRPSSALRTVIARAPCLLERGRRRIFFITGARGAGKSMLAAALAAGLTRRGLKSAGIVAEGLWGNGERAGFDLLDLFTGGRVPLARRGPGGTVRAGPFRFEAEGLAAGAAALSPEKISGAGVVFMDELGPLELEGGGWAPQLGALLGSDGPPLVLVVREELLEKVLARWRLKPSAVWRAPGADPEKILSELLVSAAISTR